MFALAGTKHIALWHHRYLPSASSGAKKLQYNILEMSALCQKRTCYTRSTLEVGSLKKRHQCSRHRRDQLFFASVYRKRLRLADSNCSTGLHYFAPKYETLTSSRREQVCLEFNREDSRIIGHK